MAIRAPALGTRARARLSGTYSVGGYSASLAAARSRSCTACARHVANTAGPRGLHDPRHGRRHRERLELPHRRPALERPLSCRRDGHVLRSKPAPHPRDLVRAVRLDHETLPRAPHARPREERAERGHRQARVPSARKRSAHALRISVLLGPSRLVGHGRLPRTDDGRPPHGRALVGRCAPAKRARGPRLRCAWGRRHRRTHRRLHRR